MIGIYHIYTTKSQRYIEKYIEIYHYMGQNHPNICGLPLKIWTPTNYTHPNILKKIYHLVILNKSLRAL